MFFLLLWCFICILLFCVNLWGQWLKWQLRPSLSVPVVLTKYFVLGQDAEINWNELNWTPTSTPNPPGMTLPRTAWVRLNRLRAGVGCFHSCLHICGMAHLWLVSVAQKNRPLTMLSFTVQSIDFLMECMAWRFWMTRQSNGCSTPAPRSSAA